MKYKSIDLFAGIGGIRLGFDKAFKDKIETVFVSEWDKFAQETYKINYNDGFEIQGDITKIDERNIPQFDICLAGFPCQAFSLAGQRQGFEDNYKGLCRGTLFQDVVRICELHKPSVIFCENVKGLIIHDRGRTFEVITKAFEEIGYKVYSCILNSKDFGVPQNRERIYIVAFRNDINSSDFRFPSGTQSNTCIGDIIEDNSVSVKYYLSDVYVDTLKRHKERHKAKGNGFGYEIRALNSQAGAIVCGGMGRERNLIIDKRLKDFTPITHIKGEVNREFIRKLTPREWARLQGFPDDFKLELADTHLYKQLGNSVTVNVIEAIAYEIKKVLKENENIEFKNNACRGDNSLFENGKFNSGEWAELYTFLNIICENNIYKPNSTFEADLNKAIQADFIIKNEDNSKKRKYIIDEIDKSISYDFLEYSRKVDRSQIYSSYYWLRDMLMTKATKFIAPDSFCSDMDLLSVNKVKAPSSCFADLVVGIRNKYGEVYEESCSVKSSLRDPSTPFNAGKATRIIYEIDDCSDDEMNFVNNMYICDKNGNIKYNDKNIPSKDIVGRINRIASMQKDGRIVGIKYFGVTNDIFKENLDNTAARLDEVLAYSILYSIFIKRANKINKLIEVLEEFNPIDINVKDYKFKLNKFIKNASLGMTAGTRYEEEPDDAGLLIVNKKGNIVFINAREKAEYYRYLYDNIKIDRPSSKDNRPTAYGDIYHGRDGLNGENPKKKYITLNFQLRLK